jgi:NAD(P)H-dependent FMN reductase
VPGMSLDPLDVVVILGSTREGRFGPVVARWFMRQARTRDDMHVQLIDLVDVDLPSSYPAERSDPVDDFVRRIGSADAFVVITPEYNHGYPAALKQAIDLPYNEWRAKPVGFVSYGGMAGGLRAVEQLRQVFAELHVATMRDSVSFHMVGGRFDGEGNPYDPEGCDQAAATMLDQLAWWGNALRTARHADAARAADLDEVA